MKKVFFTSVFMLILMVMSSSNVHGQTTTIDPCPQLISEVGAAQGQLASWQFFLKERRDSLASAQIHLQVLQGYLSLFYATVAAQLEPMTEGQSATLAVILSAITDTTSYITQQETLVIQAQSQITIWARKLYEAIQARDAAGC